MNTEKKAKTCIIAAFIVVLIVAVWMFVNTAQAEARWGQGKGYNGDCPQTCAEPGDCWKWQDEDFFPEYKYEEEGFNDFQDWWDAVLEERASWEGKADEAIDKYGDYLTEKQENRLQELEDEILNATNMTCITNKSGLFKTITNEAQKKMDEEAAQTAAANAAAAQYTYQNQNVTNDYSTNSSQSYCGNYSGDYYDFLRDGIVHYGGNKYTYYSQSVLPGGGLDIPGRHVEGGFVMDGDGYIVVANDSANGTLVDTPFGPGKVYDKGTSGNHYDIYVE